LRASDQIITTTIITITVSHQLLAIDY